jgi:eukaryotic-like serine/threonine-protein kinase
VASDFADRPDSKRLPRQLGAFLIDKEVWRGVNSTVYLARDSRDHSPVALKVLYPTDTVTIDMQRRSAMLEASRLRQLSHPNIVPLRKHGEIDGVPYLSFPYIEGFSLDQALQRGQITPGLALQAMYKVTRALQQAHNAGIIHRDLKPRNVLIDQANEPHVLDWGLSWKKGEKSETGVQKIVGTPAYLSPEQARGEEETLSAASDVYSLGAILYHLLTGKPPFEAETSWKTMQMVMSLPPRPPSAFKTTIDLRIERVILWALAKEPEKRYPDAGALAEDLQRVSEGGSPRGPAGFLGRLFKKG